jgi:hypothetical protein
LDKLIFHVRSTNAQKNIKSNDRFTLQEYRKFEDGCRLMMEAASISETSVNFLQTTQRNNPEDSHLHTRRCDNMKSRSLKLDQFSFS